MSHHNTTNLRCLPEPTIKDRLWGTQEQLHDIARRLDQPGPHGAQYTSDLYDILGALKVATADLHEIIQRATGLLTYASDHDLTTRPLTREDRAWLACASVYAWHLTGALEQAQTTINDIGGRLTTPAPSSTPPRN